MREEGKMTYEEGGGRKALKEGGGKRVENCRI